MARPISSIESHPQRQMIVDSLLAGETLRDIAAQLSPAVSIAAISRFKLNALAKTQSAFTAVRSTNANNVATHSEEDVKAVTRAALAVAIDPFVAAAQRSAARRERWMDDLEAQPDIDSYRVLATLDKNDLAAQEFHARLANRLDSVAGGNTTNNLNVYLGIPRGDPSRVIEGRAVEPSDD